MCSKIWRRYGLYCERQSIHIGSHGKDLIGRKEKIIMSILGVSGALAGVYQYANKA